MQVNNHKPHTPEINLTTPDQKELSRYLTKVRIKGIAMAILGTAVITASVAAVPTAFVLSGGTAAIIAVAIAILAVHAGGIPLYDGINMILETRGKQKEKFQNDVDQLPHFQSIEDYIKEDARPKIQEGTFLTFLVP